MPLVFPYLRDSLMKLVDAKSNLGTLSTQTLSHISLIAAYNWRNLGCKQKSSMNVSWHQRDLVKTPELIRNRKNRWLPLKKKKTTKEPKQKKSSKQNQNTSATAEFISPLHAFPYSQEKHGKNSHSFLVYFAVLKFLSSLLHLCYPYFLLQVLLI